MLKTNSGMSKNGQRKCNTIESALKKKIKNFKYANSIKREFKIISL